MSALEGAGERGGNAGEEVRSGELGDHLTETGQGFFDALSGVGVAVRLAGRGNDGDVLRPGVDGPLDSPAVEGQGRVGNVPADRKPREDGLGVGHLWHFLGVHEGGDFEPPHASGHQPGRGFELVRGGNNDVDVLESIAEEDVRDFDLHLDHALRDGLGVPGQCVGDLFRGKAGEVPEDFLGVLSEFRSEPPDRPFVAGDLRDDPGKADGFGGAVDDDLVGLDHVAGDVVAVLGDAGRIVDRPGGHSSEVQFVQDFSEGAFAGPGGDGGIELLLAQAAGFGGEQRLVLRRGHRGRSPA